MNSWNTLRESWDERSQRMGKAGIFNTRLGTAMKRTEHDAIQRAAILPLLIAELDGTERTALDFGCGWGRWTRTIADLIDGHAIGVDPTPHFLELAERSAHTEFRLYQDGQIPCDNASIDLVWCSLVLSVVLDERLLNHTVVELGRVLKPGGLMFLSDNTAGPSGHVRGRWSMSRTVEEYIKAFSGWTQLRLLGQYENLGEVDSILAGRKVS